MELQEIVFFRMGHREAERARISAIAERARTNAERRNPRRGFRAPPGERTQSPRDARPRPEASALPRTLRPRSQDAVPRSALCCAKSIEAYAVVALYLHLAKK